MRKHVYKYKYKYEYSRSIQNKSREGGLHFYQGHLRYISERTADRRDRRMARVGARVGTENEHCHT